MVHTSNPGVLVVAIALSAAAPSFAAPIDAHAGSAAGGKADPAAASSSGGKGSGVLGDILGGAAGGATNAGVTGIIHGLTNRSLSPNQIQNEIEQGSPGGIWGTADVNTIQNLVSRSDSSFTSVENEFYGGSVAGGVQGFSGGGGLGAGAAGSPGVGILGSLFNRTIGDSVEARDDVSSVIAGLTGSIEGATPRALETRKSGGALKSAGAGAAGSLGLGILGSLFNRTVEERASVSPISTNGTKLQFHVVPDPDEAEGSNVKVAVGRHVAKADIAQTIQRLGLRALKRELVIVLQARELASGMPGPAPLRRDIQELFARAFEVNELD